MTNNQEPLSSPFTVNSPNFDEVNRFDNTPFSSDLINEGNSPISTPRNEQINESVPKEKKTRTRKRDRSQKIQNHKSKIPRNKSNNFITCETNWNYQNKTKLEDQVAELTLCDLKKKQKNLTINEYIKFLEGEVCRHSVENIIQTAKVDALNEERKQAQELILDLRDSNSKIRKKAKRVNQINKKLKIKLGKLSLGNNNQNQNNLKKQQKQEQVQLTEQKQERYEINEQNNLFSEKQFSNNNQMLQNNFSIQFEEEQDFNEYNYNSFEESEYEEGMKKEFESFVSSQKNSGNTFNPNLLFEGMDLSLLTSMHSPNIISHLEKLKELYKKKRNKSKQTAQIIKHKNINPEYQRINKNKIQELKNNLKKININNNKNNPDLNNNSNNSDNEKEGGEDENVTGNKTNELEKDAEETEEKDQGEKEFEFIHKWMIEKNDKYNNKITELVYQKINELKETNLQNDSTGIDKLEK
ncbi:hypothetical protein M0812_11760 [Anaeramoeba flamelloides]|uniref:BZIP domain-containing protein n=1 Tax=Anaeramoeba flamelloides TaxID=1746091 RepID=A0AAV7ZVC5_9EUKA|nr:hypothetical protein M0812_11760 [Anaeramoeba flamelloides]